MLDDKERERGVIGYVSEGQIGGFGRERYLGGLVVGMKN